MELGRCAEYLRKQIEKYGCIHATLIDQEKTSPKKAKEVVREVLELGSKLILEGGSGYVDRDGRTEKVARAIKEEINDFYKRTDERVLLVGFPGNRSQVAPSLDAIFFLRLLNAPDRRFLIDEPMAGVRQIKEYGLDVIKVGYLITRAGTTAAKVTKALIPPDEPKEKRIELINNYALYLLYSSGPGAFLYLDAGSGAKKPEDPEVVRAVKEETSLNVIVGGGVKDYETARKLSANLADIIVTGTVLEEDLSKLEDILNGIEEGVKERKNVKRVRGPA